MPKKDLNIHNRGRRTPAGCTMQIALPHSMDVQFSHLLMPALRKDGHNQAQICTSFKKSFHCSNLLFVVKFEGLSDSNEDICIPWTVLTIGTYM